MISFQSDNGVMVNGKMLTEKTEEELIEIILKERERSRRSVTKNSRSRGRTCPVPERPGARLEQQPGRAAEAFLSAGSQKERNRIPGYFYRSARPANHRGRFCQPSHEALS
jgi:hypothetical protein